MTDETFRVVTLNSDIERSQFDSGSAPLDRYFRTQVSQDVRRRVAACFVAVTDAGRVAGFYTLASTSVLLADLPSAIAKKLPRYPSVPAISMGRLAVDQYFKGKGLGGALLADALSRAVCAEIAAYALVVDAKDGIAACFYNHHGFITFPSNPLKLFLPLATARSAIV
ncbi:MAG: GNAT family N-acetyltransferase [Janthinobacterium lividum]